MYTDIRERVTKAVNENRGTAVYAYDNDGNLLFEQDAYRNSIYRKYDSHGNMTELNTYSFYEWLVCLEEKVLLEYAVPIFSRVLVHYPFLYGIHWQGEVLYQVTIIEFDFWSSHFDWEEFFISIVNDVLNKYTITELTNLIPKEYIYQFKKFVMNK